MYKIRMRTKVEVVIGIFFLILLGAIAVESVTRTISDDQDNVYTLIRNSNGKYWDVTVANIQVAINDLSNTSGAVWLPGLQTFTVSKTIMMGIDVTLDLGGSKIKPSGNFDVVHMMPGSQLQNGFIDVSAITTFNRACILFDGKDSAGSSYLYSNHPQTAVFNICMNSASYRGIGIWMVCDHSTSAIHSIDAVSIRHVRARLFRYALLMNATNGVAGQQQWINNTHVDDCWFNVNTYNIYIRATGINNYVAANDFTRIAVQPQNTNTLSALYCDGWYNYFNMMAWDWSGAGGRAYEFTSASKYNILDARGGKSTFLDSGTGNLNRIPG